MEEDLQLGANLDTRSEEEKLKDYRFEEIAASVNPVNWVEKPRSTWRKFPIFNQDGSGSCVAQTIKKLALVMYWLKNKIFVLFSATDIYQRRSNKPGSGMIGVEAFKLWKDGITLEELAKSEAMTDTEMDALDIPAQAREAGKAFKLGNFVTLPTGDIDTIASVIQTTGKAVMVWTFWQSDEWGPVPEIKNTSLNLHSAPGRHSTAAVDFTLYNGKKALIIDESWGKTATVDGQRVLTEDFFKVRNWFAAYPINFAFDDQTQPKPEPQPEPNPNKPKHTFNRDLEFSAVYKKDSEVVALQDILKYEGFFPTNTSSTGYFGAITKTAVQKFQVKYNIAHQGNAGYGRVGPKTRAKLNEIYS